MSLSTVIQKVAQTAFKAIGDIPITCDYTSIGTSVYVPATGAYTSNDMEYDDFSFLFEEYTQREITDSGGVILSTDQKASIPSSNLTPDPKIKDIITDSNSQKWTIENLTIDSALALWVFQVRRTA